MCDVWILENPSPRRDSLRKYCFSVTENIEEVCSEEWRSGTTFPTLVALQFLRGKNDLYKPFRIGLPRWVAVLGYKEVRA